MSGNSDGAQLTEAQQAQALYQKAQGQQRAEMAQAKPNESERKAIFQLYRTAASLGDPAAGYQLAECFRLGYGTNLDFNNANSYYSCVEPKNSLVLIGLGQIHWLGDHFLAADEQAANRYFAEALTQGATQEQIDAALEECKKLKKQRRWDNLQGTLFLFAFFYNIIALFASVGFGIYLSTLLAPLIISAVLSTGLAPWTAFSLGIAASFGIIFGSLWVLGLGTSVIKAFIRSDKLESYNENPASRFLTALRIFTFFSALAAIGFGIYLATLIAPAMIAALTVAGISQGLARFIAIAASLVMISATVDLFCSLQ